MTASWNFARRPFQDVRPAYAAAAVLFLAGAVLLVLNVRLFTSYRRGVADVRGEIAALEARQHAAETKSREATSALSSYRLSALAEESRELSRIVAERRFSWTGLLARLERTLPSDVGISRLQPQFDKEGAVVLDLQLVGRSRDAVVPTIAALTRDPAFTGVELRTETQPEGNTADPFQFSVVSRYAPEATAPSAVAASEKIEKKPAAKPGPKPGAKKPAPKPGVAAGPSFGPRRPTVHP